MEDGLNEINKQVNELNAAANEKVEVNCEKACNARYNALLDKLLYAEKKGFYGIQEEGRKIYAAS